MRPGVLITGMAHSSAALYRATKARTPVWEDNVQAVCDRLAAALAARSRLNLPVAFEIRERGIPPLATGQDQDDERAMRWPGRTRKAAGRDQLAPWETGAHSAIVPRRDQ